MRQLDADDAREMRKGVSDRESESPAQLAGEMGAHNGKADDFHARLNGGCAK